MRVEETLMILAKMLSESNYKDLAGAGVVLTGGMTKLEGLRELASAVFDSMPVRVAKPKELDGLVDVLRDPANSCAIGLCLYGAGYFTPYEIDSERKLRYKDDPLVKYQGLISIKEMDDEREKNFIKVDEKEDEINTKTQNYENLDLKIESVSLDKKATANTIKSSINPFSKFVNYLKNLF